MTTADPGPESFEHYPRGPLRLRWARRDLFAGLVAQVRVLAEPGRRGGARRLAELGTLPDEVLGALRPGLAAGGSARVEQGYVHASDAEGRGVPLFEAGSPAHAALVLFDGCTPLREAAQALAASLGWEPARAFAYARGVFLHLVSLGICAPR